MHTPTPRPIANTPARPTLDRRSLVRGAAWSVPAIALATAAPAYATSTASSESGKLGGAASPSCVEQTVIAVPATWSVTSGALVDSGDTGWLTRGKYGTPGVVSTGKATWFDGSRTQPGASNQPDGSFISFADNARPNASTTVLVRYAFEVTGHVEVQVSGALKLGYGDSGTSPQRTERQLVDVRVTEAGGSAQTVAKVAHRREKGWTYYPKDSSGAYRSLYRSDADVAAQGYDLHVAHQGTHTYTANFSSPPLEFSGTGRRTLHVEYLLTLHRSPSSWVNDDVVITPPTVTVRC